VKGSTESLAGAVAKLSPPAGVLGATAAGWNLPDYAALAALVYTALMTAKLLWDWIVHPAIKRRRKD
jgi:hypothetical protein